MQSLRVAVSLIESTVGWILWRTNQRERDSQALDGPFEVVDMAELHCPIAFSPVPPTTRTFQSLGTVKRSIGAVKDEEISLHSCRDPRDAQHSF